MNLYTTTLLEKNYKFAVTGHSSGIGRLIYETFDSVGLSRTNGFDISTSAGRKKIIEAAVGCDVFVNCAFDLYGQIDLLYELNEAFHGRYIVNLSSNSSDGIKNSRHRYAVIKTALDKASEQLFYSSDKEIINLRPGYVHTERTQGIDAKMMSPSDVVEAMSFSICSGFSVKEITFSVK